MNLSKASIALIFSLFFLTFSCKDTETNGDDFNRVPMLTNIADNLIIPNYSEMQTKLSDLSSKVQALNTNPSLTNLQDAQSSWLEACKKWQHCKAFEIGPAMSIALRSSMNIYPVDTSLIQANITSGSYTIGSVSNATAIGLQALDYLLFNGNDNDIVIAISSNPNYQQYMVDLIDKMTSEIDYVESEWNNSYRTTFLASTGTASGSSTNNLYNEFVFDIELVKNAKYGIPLGKDILDMPRLNFVEAYYSGHSNTLALENIIALENLFLGNSTSGLNGIGFDDYLDHVGAKRGNENLSLVITNKFTEIKSEIAALGNPLTSELQNNYSQVNDLYFTIKDLVLYAKTDMSSALGLIIEFFDNDGD